MKLPAARVGDLHICPAVTGLVPHVGGPTLPPGALTVLIGGKTAIRVTDMLQCIGPPDVVSQGVATVLIKGLPAARITDSCAHGGMIVMGCPTVLIGPGSGGTVALSPSQIAGALGQGVFPGQQHFGNCGVQSVGQMIYLATGKHPSETALLDNAVAEGLAAPGQPGHPEDRGGTNPVTRQALLKQYGVESDVAPTTRAGLAQAVRDGKGAIVSTDAGLLWNDPRYAGGGHAVTVTGGTFDSSGALKTVTVNDTGIGERHEMSADDFFKATDNYGPGSQMNIPSTSVFPH
jgi:uncharacterized Zn-binding protein involved in type VI secretion